jgi:hypothetical protein
MNADKKWALFIGVFPRLSAAQKTFGSADGQLRTLVPSGGHDLARRLINWICFDETQY